MPWSFSDPAAAEENLLALAAVRNIVCARIFDGQGQVFASYESDTHLSVEQPETLQVQRPAAYLRGSRLHLYEPIDFLGERLGTIYLQSDMRDLIANVGTQFLTAGLGFVLLIMLTTFLSSRFQSLITFPILQLAATASRIAADADYSRRVEKPSNDEIGLLVDRFNQMLETIEEQDTALRAARDQLEDRGPSAHRGAGGGSCRAPADRRQAAVLVDGEGGSAQRGTSPGQEQSADHHEPPPLAGPQGG